MSDIPDRVTVHFIRDITGLSLPAIRALLDEAGIPHENDIVNRSDIPPRERPSEAWYEHVIAPHARLLAEQASADLGIPGVTVEYNSEPLL